MMKKRLLVNSVCLLLIPACWHEAQKDTMELHTTESGLQYHILKEGNGEKPIVGQKVTVHYTGWLKGDEDSDNYFDSSHSRNQPFQFTLSKPGFGQVIKGWDEGVADMKVGEKRRLVIPAHLGYGERGFPGAIPPNATLIFDVELLKAE
jgi:FKBP-type peptidyl-prolyl cis-trans isomerase FkpA